MSGTIIPNSRILPVTYLVIEAKPVFSQDSNFTQRHSVRREEKKGCPRTATVPSLNTKHTLNIKHTDYNGSKKRYLLREEKKKSEVKKHTHTFDFRS